MSSVSIAPTEGASVPRRLAPWPHFGPEEIEAATRVLRSGRVNYWTGTECREFEREYAEHSRVRRAIAAANGTITLELALRALGVGPGDDVIVAPRSFMASASCVVMCGAHPIFADVDRESGNVSAETIAAVLTPRTRAVIPVHLAGWPCEMDPIMQLAQERGLHVIEDCAQAHGATYRGRPIGSLGHVGSFSFCQDKIITTGGEGGALTTNNDELWSALWSLKEHGKSHEACFQRQWPAGFRWVHESFGTNGRMTEMQAAIGRVALRQLAQWTATRRRHAARLDACLGAFAAVRVPVVPGHMGHARYKHCVYTNPAGLRDGWTRDRVMNAIAARGVPCFSGGCSDIYLEKAFASAGLHPPERLPIARELGETSLTFLVHPTLSESEIEWMCGEISSVLKEASR
jgi:dTDP-4-amino-4,6-dideoxygalactose transaminase